MTRRSKGFTLFELMTVVTIVGVLCVMAAPTFTAALRHRQLDQLARALSSAVYFARSQAMLTRSYTTIDLNNNYFQVRTSYTNKILSRYPQNSNEFIDSQISMAQSDLLFFNFSGCLVDNRTVPNAQTVVTLKDNSTQETLYVTVYYTGSVKISPTN